MLLSSVVLDSSSSALFCLSFSSYPRSPSRARRLKKPRSLLHHSPTAENGTVFFYSLRPLLTGRGASSKRSWLPSVETCVAQKKVLKSSANHFRQCYAGRPRPRSSPRASFPNTSRSSGIANRTVKPELARTEVAGVVKSLPHVGPRYSRALWRTIASLHLSV